MASYAEQRDSHHNQDTVSRLSLVGMGLSLLCAIHCATLPLLITILPTVGGSLMENAFLEWGLIGTGFFIGSWSVMNGYRNYHDNLMVVIASFIGFGLIMSHLVLHVHNPILSIAGGLIVGIAQFQNWRLVRAHKCGKTCHHKA